MGYDAWLESGLYGLEVDEPPLAEVKAANRKCPYEFDIDAWVDRYNNVHYAMVDNEARRHTVPNNARAKRIRQRVFKRLVSAMIKKRKQDDAKDRAAYVYDDNESPIWF